MTGCVFSQFFPKPTVPGVCARGPTLFVKVSNTQQGHVVSSMSEEKSGTCFASSFFQATICAGGSGGPRGPTEIGRHRRLFVWCIINCYCSRT